MRTTATAEEIRDNFLIGDIQEALQKIAAELDKMQDYKASVSLICDIIEALPERTEKEMTPLDRMAWIARQSYISGFIEGTATSFESVKASYESLFRDGKTEGEDHEADR